MRTGPNHKNRNKRVRFELSCFETLQALGPYDFILAANVFVRDVVDSAKFPLYLFTYFEQQVIQFDALLKKHGIICLINCKHDFKKTILFTSGSYRSYFSDQLRKNFFEKVY